MGAKTAIAWTDSTFNPVWGCTKIDPGCENCYADVWAARMGLKLWGPHPSFRTFGDKHWDEPRKWDAAARIANRRHRVFCASMTDIFHAEMPRPVLDRVWDLVRSTPYLDWLLLTKRADRIASSLPSDWTPRRYFNAWLGVSVCDQKGTRRIDDLRQIDAGVRFLSIEPLLEPLPNLNLEGIHWVIVGAESGNDRRPMQEDWVRDLRDQCLRAGVGYFYKQAIDAKGRKIETPELDGRRWTEPPRGATHGREER